MNPSPSILPLAIGIGLVIVLFTGLLDRAFDPDKIIIKSIDKGYVTYEELDSHRIKVYEVNDYVSRVFNVGDTIEYDELRRFRK